MDRPTLVIFQRPRPISTCASCDRPLAEDPEVVVVTYPGTDRLEDYCGACFDAALLCR